MKEKIPFLTLHGLAIVNKPNFLIIGAQRSGTTSLWTAFREHPGIHVANEKELNYFNNPITAYKTVEWYEQQFIPDLDVQFTDKFDPDKTPMGEASPNYCISGTSMRRIHHYNPDFKLIITLRDPVRRAISSYWWSVKMANESLNMQDAFIEEERRLQNPTHIERYSYQMRGRYIEQLDRIAQYFDSSQILVLLFEELIVNPMKFIKRATDFIGAQAWDGYTLVNAMKNEYAGPDQVTLSALTEYFRPYNIRLMKEHGVDIGEWL